MGGRDGRRERCRWAAQWKRQPGLKEICPPLMGCTTLGPLMARGAPGPGCSVRHFGWDGAVVCYPSSGKARSGEWGEMWSPQCGVNRPPLPKLSARSLCSLATFLVQGGSSSTGWGGDVCSLYITHQAVLRTRGASGHPWRGVMERIRCHCLSSGRVGC